MDWLKSTSPIIDWVAYSLDITVRDIVHTVLTLPVNIIANVILSNLKQMLGKVKDSCPA